jgi:hypothetical protein
MSSFWRSRAIRLLAASGVGCKDLGELRFPVRFKMFMSGMYEPIAGRRVFGFVNEEMFVLPGSCFGFNLIEG